jgi:hypothetical protein
MTPKGRLFAGGFVGAVVVAAVIVLAEPALATPTLLASPSRAAAGDKITVSGGGFGSCLDSETMLTPVQLVWDGNQNLQSVPYSGESFQAQVTVPADAAVGEHSVGIECYDFRLKIVSSEVLASAPVQVIAASGPPMLQLAPSKAGPGQPLTATGSGFGQCADASGIASVLLLWDNRQPLGTASGSGGTFTAVVDVPKDAVEGTNIVVAECYDPASGDATSGPIARQTFVVAEPVADPTTSISASGSTSRSATTSASASTSASGSVASNSSTQGSTSASLTPLPRPSTVAPVTSSIPHSTSTAPRLKTSAAAWQPMAWLGGALALLLAVALLVLQGLQSRRHGTHRRGVSWVHHHVRAVARPLDRPSTQIRGGTGVTPSSLSLEPRPDQVGKQKIREVAR